MKDTHRVSRNCLNKCFNKNFPTYFRDEFLFSSHHPLSNFFLQDGCFLFIDCLAWSCLITPKQMNGCWHSSTVAWQKIKLSLGKRRWEMHTPLRHDKIPCKFCDSFAFLGKFGRPLTQSKKRYGDNRSPCFISCDGLINPLDSPLISTSHTIVPLLYTYKIEIL